MGAAQGFQIFNYEAPIVSIKDGHGRIIDGYFKLVHIIDLMKFQRLLEDITKAVDENIREDERKSVFNFHLHQIRDRLTLLRSSTHRRTRSIDWIGSAWKWVAGNPDAGDWNKILQSEQKIIENNNHQYKINEALIGVTRNITEKMNWIISKFNNQIERTDAERIEQDILHQILILKDEVNEIIRACQMARNGIVNTNLLDKEEINRIISEMETLPYENEIQAIEYGKPSVFTNNTILLYVLSMPKVRTSEYNLILTRATIRGNQQVDLKFKAALINHSETFGLIRHCLTISNSTICEEQALQKIPENGCIAKLLKGGNANCDFRTNTEEIVELVKEDTIFLTNFKGELTSNNITSTLCGTYVIQLHNETIQLNNRTFSSITSTSLQVMPASLTNVTVKSRKVDIGYIHSISLDNIERLGNLTRDIKASNLFDVIIVLLIAVVVYFIWQKTSKKINIPTLNIQTFGPAAPDKGSLSNLQVR